MFSTWAFTWLCNGLPVGPPGAILLLQVGVFGLRGDKDGNVKVGIFPEC